jgi:hypothetical protein
MNYITKDEARANIVTLGLPQIVLDAFDGKPLPYDLDIQFREPYTIFSLGPDEQATYGEGPITPIWTGGGDYIIVAYHHLPARKGFFRFDIEAPGEEEQPVGLSWQQVLVKEFKALWETEMPEDQIREVAGWFGFKYLDLLIAQLSDVENDSIEEDDAWYEAFLKRVRD